MYSKTLAILLRSQTSIHFILITFIFLLSFFFQIASGQDQNHTQDDSVPTLAIPVMQWQYLQMSGEIPQGLKDFGFGYNKQANKLIVFGGTTQDNTKSSATYIADLNAMTWTSLQTAQQPGARSDMVYGMDIYAGYRNTFVITGGKGNGNIVYNDTWAFDITYNTWSEITNVTSTSGPVPQMYGAVGGIDTSTQGGSQTIPNNTMWLTHGTNGSAFFTDLWAVVFGGTLATSGNALFVTWTKIPTTKGSLPEGRKVTGGTILPGGRLAMYGGCNETTSSDCATSDVWSLNIGSNSNSGVPNSNSPTWTEGGECLGSREGAAMVNNAITGVVSYRAQAISFGGKLPGKLTVDQDGEIGVYDANGGVWVRVLPQGDPTRTNNNSYPKVRSGARMIAIDSTPLGGNTSSPSIVMFGGEGLNGVTSFYNDMWVLRLTGAVSRGNQSNQGSMQFLKCIPPNNGIGSPSPQKPSPNNTNSQGPFSGFGPQFANSAININHITCSTLSFVFLPVATSIMRFGQGLLAAGSYAVLLVLSYSFLIYGFFIAIQYVNTTPISSNNVITSHFSTSHGLIGLILTILLYVVVPILTLISCVTVRKFGSYASAATSDDSESDDRSFGSKIVAFLNLKNSDTNGKQPKSFEVSRPGNRNFQNDNTRYQHPTSVLNKPTSNSWIDERKSVTIAENPTILNNTSRSNNMQNGNPNSRRTSQSTATGSYHQRLGSNGTPIMTPTLQHFYPRQRPNSLVLLTRHLYHIVYQIILLLYVIFLATSLYTTNSVEKIFFYLFLIFMVVIYLCWILLAWAGYPRSKNSLLVALMAKFGGRGDMDDSNDANGLGNDENSQTSGSELGGTDSRFNSVSNRANLHDDEMSEEAKQAELEQEIINREVVVMTIPKRRLTVVNA